jgi:hypothetical protein
VGGACRDAHEWGMSKRDRHRGKTMREKEAMVAAYSAPATFVRRGDVLGWPHEYWRRGTTLFVVPVPRDYSPPELVDALNARKVATLTGRCPMCNAVASSKGGVVDVVHDDSCPALRPRPQG